MNYLKCQSSSYIYVHIAISGTTRKNSAPKLSNYFNSSPKMSRKSSESDSQVINNSIALLQERFKQLQRAKEMREERELLKQLTESKRTNSAKCYDPSRLFFHSELIAPPKQPLQGSPSIQHSLHSMHGDLRAIETPTSATLQSTETVTYRSRNCEDSDIDTSLHL